MVLSEAGSLLRIIIGENDRMDQHPLHEWIVLQAREAGLAGATAWRGTMGFGASSRVHTSKILRLSQDLPVIIEIVDTRERLEAFMATIDPHITGGLATLESARVHLYRSKTG